VSTKIGSPPDTLMPRADRQMVFESLARDAEWLAAQADTRHVAALWREFATSYWELADYNRSSVSANTGVQRPDRRDDTVEAAMRRQSEFDNTR
jgi:hypothetical protein